MGLNSLGKLPWVKMAYKHGWLERRYWVSPGKEVIRQLGGKAAACRKY